MPTENFLFFSSHVFSGGTPRQEPVVKEKKGSLTGQGASFLHAVQPGGKKLRQQKHYMSETTKN